MGPIIQKMLEAKMDAKIGYQKNEHSDVDNYRNFLVWTAKYVWASAITFFLLSPFCAIR